MKSKFGFSAFVSNIILLTSYLYSSHHAHQPYEISGNHRAGIEKHGHLAFYKGEPRCSQSSVNAYSSVSAQSTKVAVISLRLTARRSLLKICETSSERTSIESVRIAMKAERKVSRVILV